MFYMLIWELITWEIHIHLKFTEICAFIYIVTSKMNIFFILMNSNIILYFYDHYFLYPTQKICQSQISYIHIYTYTHTHTHTHIYIYIKHLFFNLRDTFKNSTLYRLYFLR